MISNICRIITNEVQHGAITNVNVRGREKNEIKTRNWIMRKKSAIYYNSNVNVIPKYDNRREVKKDNIK